MSLASKEVDEVVRLIRKTGKYKVVKNGNAHWKVLTMSGAAVVDANGPLILSSTPSDGRWKEMSLNRLIKAGVFPSDPFKQHQQSGNGNGGGDKASYLISAEVREKARASQAAASKERHERTLALRQRLEPLVAKTGGWASGRDPGRSIATSGVTPAELALVGYEWGRRRGRLDNHKTLSGAAQVVTSTIKAGGTLGDGALGFWSAFVDEWERHDGFDDARAWYFDQLRIARGIAREPEGGAAVPLPTSSLGTPLVTPLALPAPPASAPPPAPQQGPAAGPLASPQLALKALYLMSVGREHSPELEQEVMLTAQKILQLEVEK